MYGKAVKSNYHQLAKLKVTQSKFVIKEGKSFPVLNAKNPQLKEVAVNYANAKYSLIEFWASWCIPCRKNNPEWNKILEQYKKSGFQIIGISLDKYEHDWISAIKKDGIKKWFHISDLGDGFNSSIALQFGIDFIPFNVLIDSNAKIVAKNISPLYLEKFLKKIQ